MIASNFRRYAEAMALQLPLPFGRNLVWHTSRPTTRWGRAMRAVRGRLAAAHSRIAYPSKKTYAPRKRDSRITVQLKLFREGWQDVADAAATALDWAAGMLTLESMGQMRLALH